MADIAIKPHNTKGYSSVTSEENSIQNNKQESLVDSIIERSEERPGVNSTDDRESSSSSGNGEELEVILESIRGIINNHKQVVSKSNPKSEPTSGPTSGPTSKDTNIEADPSSKEVRPSSDLNKDFKTEQKEEKEDIEKDYQGVNDNDYLRDDGYVSDSKEPLELTEILELDEEYHSTDEYDDSSLVLGGDNRFQQSDILSKTVADKSAKMIEEFVSNNSPGPNKDTKNSADNGSNAFDTQFGQQSLKQMVCELMRPMMKDWLDNNLPNLVEKIIREEVQKLTPRK